MISNLNLFRKISELLSIPFFLGLTLFFYFPILIFVSNNEFFAFSLISTFPTILKFFVSFLIYHDLITDLVKTIFHYYIRFF